MTRWAPATKWFVALGASSLLAAGCAGTGSPTAHALGARPGHSTTTASSTTTSTMPNVDVPPVTPISWSPCNGDLQCGSLVVPLRYDQPAGATISIAVARHPAVVPADRIGSLVINPGGPGVSGIDDMANELSVLTPQLLDDFDIVMFDPRGVERSDPVTCGEAPGSPPTTMPDPAPTTASAEGVTVAGLKSYAAACEKASSAVLPYVGTVDTARDMERLRLALGDPGLTYMGQSYGSLLGLMYASLFPTHVRAIVLDSVIDPALTFTQLSTGQADGFESELQDFFTWCAGSGECPWRPSDGPTQALLALIASSTATPVPAGNGRQAGAGELYDALLDGLYAQSDWPQLGSALAADAAGNGAQIVAMSDHYNQNGSTNGDDAALAIDCLDHPTSLDLSAYGYLAAVLGSSAPVFGPLLAWGQAACAVWPTPPTRTAGPVAAPGAPPALVIGTTNDAATPYSWAVNVSHELDKAALLTVDGGNHVSYFYSACVRSYVQTYLVSGATPPAGTTCTE